MQRLPPGPSNRALSKDTMDALRMRRVMLEQADRLAEVLERWPVNEIVQKRMSEAVIALRKAAET